MRQSCLVATAILVVFIISVGANLVHVNAGQPHPLQTGGGTGGCGGEGSVSVQEWCPGTEHKRWKRGLVCRNGVQVQETQDCSGCADPERPDDIYDEGTEIVNEDCPTSPGTGYLYKTTVCEKGKWVKHEIPCVYCSPEGGSEITNYCDDGVTPSLIKHCRNGVPVYEEKTCPTEEEIREKLPKKCGEGEERCTETCFGGLNDFMKTNCRTLVRCIHGGWERVGTSSTGIGTYCACFIATATYGSEWSPEVQLLRNFRDRDVLRTFAGSEGMKVFNSIYYSFSPQVAQTISANDNLRTVMRYLLYPLIGILWTSQQIFSALAFSPEGAVVVAALFTGSMIGLLYTLPFYGVTLAVWRVFRRRLTLRHVSASLVVLAAASTLIVVSELTRFALLMQVSTSLLVLTAAALPGIAFSSWALNRRRPVAS